MIKICTHIIIRDKFTSGYINFLKKYPFDYEHHFFTFNGEYELRVDDNKNVYVVENYKDILRKYQDILNKSDKIVVAAFFDEALALLKMKKELWGKTYIQFWGGDIYRFLNKKEKLIDKIKQFIAKKLTSVAIKKAAGVLTLVEGDYPEIERIFGVKKKHQVVQVPDDFYEINHYNYAQYRNNKDESRKILIGNSATIENQHLEVFKVLNNKKKQNFEVIVPLSYGLDDYRKQVLAKGKGCFKDRFEPILNFMDRNKYIEMLSKARVAIFNNNRQQATGNIIILFNLEKKVYLRSDTSMWPFFKKYGFILHDFNDLYQESIEEILTINDEEKQANYKALKMMEDEGVKQWESFLNN